MSDFEHRIAPFLAGRLHDERWLGGSVERLGGGSSNLTYLVRSAAGELIVRRPPFWGTLPTAHDMAREYRVLTALASTAVPVPRTILLVGVEDRLEAQCLVMERVVGPVCRDRLPTGYADRPGERHQIGLGLVDTLAELHALDPLGLDLTGFGHPHGFLERQLRRWAEQWNLTSSRRLPALHRLYEELAADVPVPQRAAIVHGDYRLDNAVLHPATPGRVAAVLDWEMSTLGDPLTDLGGMLTYWSDPDDDDLLVAARIVPPVTSSPGFPSRSELVARYAARTGLDLDRIDWYRAFACFKLAVICQGVSKRVGIGAMDGGVEDVGHVVGPLAEVGLRMIERVGVD